MDYRKTPYRSVKSYFAPLWKECREKLAEEGQTFNRQNAERYFTDKKDPDNPFVLSDDLYFEGLDGVTLQEQRDAMKKVLAINPFEYDAQLQLIRLMPVYEEKEKLPFLLALKETIEKDLFSYLSPQEENLYNEMPARPYFRVLGDLANLYHHSNEIAKEEEIEETLLKMNPNDNQGFRYLLAPLYLSRNEKEKFMKLVLAYPEETILEANSYVYACLEKDSKTALSLLKDLFLNNPYLFLYFQIPTQNVQNYASYKGEKDDSDYYEPGGYSEAKMVMDELYGCDQNRRMANSVLAMGKKLFDPFQWLKGMDELELLELVNFLFSQNVFRYTSKEDYYQGYLKQANCYKTDCESKRNYLLLAEQNKKTMEDFFARGFAEMKDGFLRLTSKGEYAALLAQVKTAIIK